MAAVQPDYPGADWIAAGLRGLVEPARLRELFQRIEPNLYRYPALSPAAFRAAVERALNEAAQ